MLQKGEQFPIFKLENQDGTVITNDTLKDKKAIGNIFILEIIHLLAPQKLVTLETI
ncbi:Thiol peroxidase, Bcp-type [Staphylococcus aureus]|uniref:Thiol peroxidase, Bcp-type n=1 Tax=Staphylococcus aureus TaxID=1280 RepID=A0A2X2M2V6_STAAU|nr:Thiol peroxidase, Bcp-type [Staphylococcus aureus]